MSRPLIVFLVRVMDWEGDFIVAAVCATKKGAEEKLKSERIRFATESGYVDEVKLED